MSLRTGLRIVLIGSVGSSRRTLLGLIRHRTNVVGVLGLSATRASGVSGYCRLDDLAEEIGSPYKEFQNINDPEIVALVQSWAPDLIFVVGLSQLVKAPMMALPRLGCVGFHPTLLPQGRGRAPVAWLALGACPGAATFFVLEDEADAGPILVQEPFPVTSEDYASDIINNLEEAIDRALARWLPRLLAGEWQPQPQDKALASYCGRRTPEDGLIEWTASAKEIHALVRAASRPHPGAYTYVGDFKLRVWRATIETQMRAHGVVGRVFTLDPGERALVQTGDGLIWLDETEFVQDDPELRPPALRAGLQLGYAMQEEIHRVRQRLIQLEAKLQKSKGT